MHIKYAQKQGGISMQYNHVASSLCRKRAVCEKNCTG